MKKIILVGCGGHAKSIVDAIESTNEYEIEGFIGTLNDKHFIYRGYRFLGTDDDLESIFNTGVTCAFLCVGFMGQGNIREVIYKKLMKIGFCLPSVIDITATIASDVKLGEGSFVGKKAVINSNAIIGSMSIINTGAIIEHDCIVGEFSHVSVSTVLCGNVSLGKFSFIGANATVIQGVVLGDNVIVGAGSIVLSNVASNQTVVGIVKQH